MAGLTVSGRPREKKCQQQYMEWKHFKYISLMADPPLISFSQSSGSCFHSIVWAGSHHWWPFVKMSGMRIQMFHWHLVGKWMWQSEIKIIRNITLRYCMMWDKCGFNFFFFCHSITACALLLAHLNVNVHNIFQSLNEQVLKKSIFLMTMVLKWQMYFQIDKI